MGSRFDDQMVQAMKDRIRVLEDLLADHHKIQSEADGIFMFWSDPKTNRIDSCDISAEYCDSSLFERTVTALANSTEKL